MVHLVAHPPPFFLDAIESLPAISALAEICHDSPIGRLSEECMPQTLTCTATSNSGGALHQPPRRASLVCHCATVPHPTPHHAGTAGWSTHIHIHTQPHPHPHMLLSPSSTYAAREMCALASVSAVVSAAASVPAASACSSRCFCSAVVMHCMLAPLVQVSQSVGRSTYLAGLAHLVC